MLKNEEAAGNYTLWLLLCEEDEAWVKPLIDELAAELGTESFYPHATLMSGLSGRGDRTEAAVRDFASAHGVVETGIAGIEFLPETFRAFFLRLENHPALLEMHAQAAVWCDEAPPSEFMPHVSLVYGQPDVEAKKALEARLRDRIQERSLRLDRLAYVYSGKGIAVSDWRIEYSFDLS